MTAALLSKLVSVFVLGIVARCKVSGNPNSELGFLLHFHVLNSVLLTKNFRNAGNSRSNGVRPPCGTRKVPYSMGRWAQVKLDPPTHVANLHELAHYRCGEMLLGAEAKALHYFCGVLSREDLNRGFSQFTWQWEPKHCYLPDRFGEDLDTLLQRFLEKAKGSKIVFVGDSLSFEQYLSLRCLLGQHVVSEVDAYGFKLANEIAIQRIQNNYLVNKTTLQVMQSGMIEDFAQINKQPSTVIFNAEIQKDFALSLNEDVYDWENFYNGIGTSYAEHVTGDETILVLSTGPHWHGNIEGYGTMVLNVLKYLQKNFRGKRVFYRAASHGHTNCTDAVSPRRNDADASLQVSYNWRLFGHYNAIWKYEISRMNDRRFMYLDTYAMSEDRADGHIHSQSHPYKNDCLHYCLPGVVDFWNLLLLSFIVHGE
jgi:hypothetical protein